VRCAWWLAPALGATGCAGAPERTTPLTTADVDEHMLGVSCRVTTDGKRALFDVGFVYGNTTDVGGGDRAAVRGSNNEILSMQPYTYDYPVHRNEAIVAVDDITAPALGWRRGARDYRWVPIHLAKAPDLVYVDDPFPKLQWTTDPSGDPGKLELRVLCLDGPSPMGPTAIEPGTTFVALSEIIDPPALRAARGGAPANADRCMQLRVSAVRTVDVALDELGTKPGATCTITHTSSIELDRSDRAKPQGS
jgi:hypothetical protein